ncbi:MAG: MFS transporter [Thermomicrobiales bacterium]|nr:MFS transporter [Thermomicrobiales bacterium]
MGKFLVDLLQSIHAPDTVISISIGIVRMSFSGRAGSNLRTTFLSLRSRNFRLFFIGHLISNTGNWLTNVALTLLVLSLTDNGLAVGILAACQYGPVLFLSTWAGAIADRSDKRRFLFVTQALSMLQSFGLAFLAFLPNPPLPALYLLAILGGILLSFDNPVRRSFVPEMVREEDIANAVVLTSLVVNTSRIFGPTLAGLLIVTMGYGWCFAIDGVSYIAVIVCLVMMRPSELRRRAPKPRANGEIREGIEYLRSIPTLWIPMVMLGAIGILAYNFTVTLPLFVTGALQSNDATFTLLYATYSFGSVVAALIVANRGLVSIRTIVIGAVLLGICMLALGSVPPVHLAFPIMLLLGGASILYMTSTTANVQVIARPDMHGRILAIQSSLMIGGTLIGAPILGGLAELFGTRTPILLGGMVCLTAATFGALTLRSRAPEAMERQHGQSQPTGHLS